MRRIKALFKWITEYCIYYTYRVYWLIIRGKYKKLRDLREKPRLLFASTPIINNKYWARAMAKAGYVSKSITFGVPAINSKEDYDIYFNDIYTADEKSSFFRQTVQKFKVLTYVLKNYDILFTSFKFQFLSQTRFWKKEAWILKSFGLKIVVKPYGNDFQMYSKILDNSEKHNLLKITYHHTFAGEYNDSFEEEAITEKVIYWKNQANIMLNGFMLDGAARWDALTVSGLYIDANEWKPRMVYNDFNGRNGKVKIAHAPNFRGYKGTEFIIHAVNELKREGLLIELILIEGKPNSEVKIILQERADFLAEQIIGVGYGLNGIEGMASGLPVMSNFDRSDITQVFRRYSYLNECPILSTTPENVKENLRILVTNPELRMELGIAGRKYAEKYHSYDSAKYFYEKIIDKIWYGKKVNLMDMYHPLLPESYNNQSSKIEHPLVENKIPAGLKDKLNR